MHRFLCIAMCLACFAGFTADNLGYYRMPSVHGDVVVFTAEGDLWKVALAGGEAIRLTTHPEEELHAHISPDGSQIAFSASYHGAQEVYVMPISGGLPKRLSFDGANANVRSWTPSGKVVYSTSHYSDLPNQQLHLLDTHDLSRQAIPLMQADMGQFTDDESSLVFNRLRFNGSWTKRYKGGTIQQLWRFTSGDDEATPLTTSYEGTSKDPMIVGDRIYFVSDRDGTMNIWSIDLDGKSPKQHTFHAGLDVRDADADGQSLVYQLGADLYCLSLTDFSTRRIPITLTSDFDQRRSQWVEKIEDTLTSIHLSPKGDRVVATAHGQVAIFPVEQGRVVTLSQGSGVRMRDAVFEPDGQSLLMLTDHSGEQEYWRFDDLGMKPPEQLTKDADVLRLAPVPAPDGKHIAFSDREGRLSILGNQSKKTHVIHQSPFWGIGSIAWSPDSQWLAFDSQANNVSSQIKLYHVPSGRLIDATTDRVESYNPLWSQDGSFLYFLSDRHFNSVVSSPWGPRQPEPFLDKSTEIYALALDPQAKFPFLAHSELTADLKDIKEAEEPRVNMVEEGLQKRLYRVPVKPGNYASLQSNGDHLFYLSYEAGTFEHAQLMIMAVNSKLEDAKVFADKVSAFELSNDGKKIMLRKEDKWLVSGLEDDVLEEKAKSLEINKWKLKVEPTETWRQMLVDAWRLERDYFYDPDMHGVDWQAVLDKHLPLVKRVTTRAELNDLIAQVVGELSALHTFVVGGELRSADDQIQHAGLGVDWEADKKRGGYRITYIYQGEPDYIDQLSPVARPNVDLKVGDTVTAINGTKTLEVAHANVLLDNQVGQQVRLSVLTNDNGQRDVVVTPISKQDEAGLRYSDWENSRRLKVDDWGQDKIGYVHLRAMGGDNYSEWVQNYFPVFNRQGLILDVRNNRGGNIDSWILERLLRQVWFYWKGRNQQVYGNMQYAFAGHLVLLMNELTASDGEAISEGFRRLGLGKVIGTRTWGGEIWLSFNNRLADGGIASAAQTGVFGLEREWLIEGVGVIPDIEVDNRPHQTFLGQDAQLRKAVDHLLELIDSDPRQQPEPPDFPNKSFEYPKDTQTEH